MLLFAGAKGLVLKAPDSSGRKERRGARAGGGFLGQSVGVDDMTIRGAMTMTLLIVFCLL